MKKFLAFILIVVLAPVLGGLYGILHDQLTYTISPEYYTKFKFLQFGLVDHNQGAVSNNPRLGAAMVGFMATWWMGIPIGIILGLTGLVHRSGLQMFRVTMQAILITMAVAFATGLVGLAWGKLYPDIGVSWWIPDNVIDMKNYIAVGSMHNFSYLGGLTGLIAGIVYSVWRKKIGDRQI